MNPTIWTLDDARKFHVHSKGLAWWLVDNLNKNFLVTDLGCGKGEYIATLENNGFDVYGFEGTPGIRSIAFTKNILELDILIPIHADRDSHVLCIEVMEHIAPEDERKVLANIKNICTNTLVLSWAVEGQPGHGHINCRNADYVVPTIEALGFKLDFLQTMSARKAAVSMKGPQFFMDSLYVFQKL